jgi:hypothetical protein
MLSLGPCSLAVEHPLGKGEVMSSILIMGSICRRKDEGCRELKVASTREASGCLAGEAKEEAAGATKTWMRKKL